MDRVCMRRAHSPEPSGEVPGRLVPGLTDPVRVLPNDEGIDEEVRVLNEEGMVVGLAGVTWPSSRCSESECHFCQR
jgi:hypothetical protein